MSRPTVLVVDDEDAFVEALTIALEREGFNPAVARDGVDAVRRFEEIRPDVVLLDLMLPGMSGVDVCREIRRSHRTPVIMVTARDSEVDAVVGLEVGADDYVTKPYRLRELVASRTARSTSPPSLTTDSETPRSSSLNSRRCSERMSVTPWRPSEARSGSRRP